MKTNLFYIFFRFLFALSLIGLGLRIYSDTSRLDIIVKQTIEQIQHKVIGKQYNLNFLKENSTNLINLDIFLLFLTGLLAFFGIKYSKFFAFFILLTHLFFINNVYLYRDPKHIISASSYIGLFGAVLCF